MVVGNENSGAVGDENRIDETGSDEDFDDALPESFPFFIRSRSVPEHVGMVVDNERSESQTQNGDHSEEEDIGSSSTMQPPVTNGMNIISLIYFP